MPVIKIAEKVNEKRDKWWVSVFYIINISGTRDKVDRTESMWNRFIRFFRFDEVLNTALPR